MTLYEYLKPLNLDTLVIISNVNRPCRTRGRAQYQKLRNIPWEKLRNNLDYDVMQVTVHKENGGLYIQVHSREQTLKSLDNWDLVDKYFKRKEQRASQGLST